MNGTARSLAASTAVGQADRCECPPPGVVQSVLIAGCAWQGLTSRRVNHSSYPLHQLRIAASCPNADVPFAQRNGHVVYEFEPACHLGAKLAGVHWWHKSRAHAAELTAGYYNTRERDGYAPLMKLLAKHGARVSFTCVEMRDCEHPPEGRCSPQGRSHVDPVASCTNAVTLRPRTTSAVCNLRTLRKAAFGSTPLCYLS